MKDDLESWSFPRGVGQSDCETTNYHTELLVIGSISLVSCTLLLNWHMGAIVSDEYSCAF